MSTEYLATSQIKFFFLNFNYIHFYRMNGQFFCAWSVQHLIKQAWNTWWRCIPVVKIHLFHLSCRNAWQFSGKAGWSNLVPLKSYLKVVEDLIFFILFFCRSSTWDFFFYFQVFLLSFSLWIVQSSVIKKRNVTVYQTSVIVSKGSISVIILAFLT